MIVLKCEFSTFDFFESVFFFISEYFKVSNLNTGEVATTTSIAKNLQKRERSVEDQDNFNIREDILG